MGLKDTIDRLLGRTKEDAETAAEGGEPISITSPAGDGETSTNAQVQGASDEPWPGND